MKAQNDIVNSACEGDLTAVESFLTKGVEENQLNEAFSCAVGYGHIDVAELLLRHGASFEAWSHDAVYWACHNGNEAGVRWALSNGVDINVQNGMILSTSIYHMSDDFIQWLISAGADVNAKEGEALFTAISNQRPSVLLMLVKNGAQTGVRDGAIFKEAMTRADVRMHRAIQGLPLE